MVEKRQCLFCRLRFDPDWLASVLMTVEWLVSIRMIGFE